MGKKLTQEQYNYSKIVLDRTKANGKDYTYTVAAAAKVAGIGEMTARRIRKSKNYKSYEALSRNSKITTAERKLMKTGMTLKEARDSMTVAQPEDGGHELQNENSQFMANNQDGDSVPIEEATPTVDGEVSDSITQLDPPKPPHQYPSMTGVYITAVAVLGLAVYGGLALIRLIF